jgi:hypothetical protein
VVVNTMPPSSPVLVRAEAPISMAHLANTMR